MQVRLLIDAVDLTATLTEEWSIDARFGYEIGTARFVLNDPNNSISVSLGQDVVVEDWSDSLTRLFGGIISDIDMVPNGLGRAIAIRCQDWKKLLDRASINTPTIYYSKTDQYIIQAAFTAAGLTEIDTTKVTAGRTISVLGVTDLTLRQVLDAVSYLTGYVWNITPFKVLTYSREGSSAPPSPFYQFTDATAPNGTSNIPYFSPQYSKQIGEYNVVKVRGGGLLSADITDIYAGNGARKLFITGEAAGTSPVDRAPVGENRVVVEVNTGTDVTPVWTAQTVGIVVKDTLGAGGITVLWNVITHQLEFNTAPSNFTNGWRITGRMRTPYRIIVKNQDSIDSLGHEYIKTMDVSQPVDDAELTAIAVGFLHAHEDSENMSIQFYFDGVEVGDVVRVTSAKFGLTAKPFTVQKLSIILKGGTTALYTATLGKSPYSLSRVFGDIGGHGLLSLLSPDEGEIPSSVIVIIAAAIVTEVYFPSIANEVSSEEASVDTDIPTIDIQYSQDSSGEDSDVYSPGILYEVSTEAAATETAVYAPTLSVEVT